MPIDPKDNARKFATQIQGYPVGQLLYIQENITQPLHWVTPLKGPNISPQEKLWFCPANHSRKNKIAAY